MAMSSTVEALETEALQLSTTERGRLPVVAHVEHGESIRIINARSTTRLERKHHET
jgi:uncharacterized DUF497 family protein